MDEGGFCGYNGSKSSYISGYRKEVFFTDRTILHCDCNSFFASVECLFNPQYKDVPMAVCGDAESRRGIVLAKNEPAKKYGIKTAEPNWMALKKCPQLIIVPPRHGIYSEISRTVNQIYCSYTDLVEPFGVDESWLDVTGSRRLFGDGFTIAETLRKRIREEVGLTVSIGVSFNKVFAKLGSDYKKPDATTVISRENFRSIVWPLPVADLLFVGHSCQEALKKIGVNTIGQLAQFDRDVLTRLLGKIGAGIHDYANGLDDSPVSVYGTESAPKSVSNGTTLAADARSTSELRACVTALCDLVAARLRIDGMRAKTVQVTLKNPAFEVKNRQMQLDAPTDITAELIDAAMRLISAVYREGTPVRAVTVCASNLTAEDDEEQLPLFDTADARREKLRELECAKDAIRSRFGRGALRYANTAEVPSPAPSRFPKKGGKAVDEPDEKK